MVEYLVKTVTITRAVSHYTETISLYRNMQTNAEPLHNLSQVPRLLIYLFTLASTFTACTSVPSVTCYSVLCLCYEHTSDYRSAMLVDYDHIVQRKLEIGTFQDRSVFWLSACQS